MLISMCAAFTRWRGAARWRLLALLATCAACALLPACNTSKGKNAEGVAYYLHGQPDYALQTFQAAQAQDPTNPNVYYNIARVYHHKGLDYYSKARETSDAAESQRLQQLGASSLNQAESYYNLCLDRDQDGTHRDCYRALAVLLVNTRKGSDDERAFTLLKRWAANRPTNPDPKIELARLYEEHGQYEPAKEHLLDALTLEPNNPRALAALGNVRERLARNMGGQEQQRELAQALANYRRSLQVDRQQPEVQSRVAVLQTTYPGLDARLVQPDGRRMVQGLGSPAQTRVTPRL